MARTADPDLAERRRRQIMDAAIACFRRRGFHQSSMHEICAEAGLSAGAVYRYFPSKTDIIAAIAEGDGETWRATFKGVTGAADLIDRIVGFAESFVETMLAQGDAPLMGDVMAEALRDPALAQRLRAGVEPMKARLLQVIREGQAAGALDPDLDPERAARLIFGAVDGVCMRALLGGGAESALIGADLREVLTRLLRPGVQVERPARRNGAQREAQERRESAS
jgi:AcrR family transcriptional regulator